MPGLPAHRDGVQNYTIVALFGITDTRRVDMAGSNVPSLVFRVDDR